MFFFAFVSTRAQLPANLRVSSVSEWCSSSADSLEISLDQGSEASGLYLRADDTDVGVTSKSILQ
jgi:hypothetical protein